MGVDQVWIRDDVGDVAWDMWGTKILLSIGAGMIEWVRGKR